MTFYLMLQMPGGNVIRKEFRSPLERIDWLSRQKPEIRVIEEGSQIDVEDIDERNDWYETEEGPAAWND